MAAVGSVEGEKSVQESEDSAKNAWSNITDMCRKNGLHSACQCHEKSCRSNGAKGSFVNVVRTNGASKIASLANNLKTTVHSIALRSRVESDNNSQPISLRKTKRSSVRGESSEDLSSQEVGWVDGSTNDSQRLLSEDCSGNNNNNDVDSSSAVDRTSARTGPPPPPRKDSPRNAATASSSSSTSSSAASATHNCDTDRSSKDNLQHSDDSDAASKETRNHVFHNCSAEPHTVHNNRQPSHCRREHPQDLSTKRCSLVNQYLSPKHSSSAKSKAQACTRDGSATCKVEAPELSHSCTSPDHQSPHISSLKAAKVNRSSSHVTNMCNSSAVRTASKFCTVSAGHPTGYSSGILNMRRRNVDSLCGFQAPSPVHFSQAQQSSSGGVSWPSTSAHGIAKMELVSSRTNSLDSDAGSTNSSNDTATCQWDKCGCILDASVLMDHLRSAHVESQLNGEKKLCLWEGCKVYNKSSSSQSWLERHMLSHSGDKPFRCIFDHCGMRFTSQFGLERHVNSHISNAPQPVNPKLVRAKDDTPSKHHKKRKARRKRPWTAKTDDFFDSCIMESIRHRLVLFNQATQMDTSGSAGNRITFQSTVIARRRDSSGQVQVLLHWTPENIINDSWVPESQAAQLRERTVQMSSLPHDSLSSLDASGYSTHRHRKHRRK